MDSTGDGRNSIGIVLIGHPELAAKGPEGTRHYSCIFNGAGPPVMDNEPDIGDSSGPVNLPDAAAGFTRHEHVVPERALMIERNPGVVRRAACVWDDRKECGGIG